MLNANCRSWKAAVTDLELIMETVDDCVHAQNDSEMQVAHFELERLVKAALQASHPKGRDEGLEEAAKWSCGCSECRGNGGNNRGVPCHYNDAIRALRGDG